MGVSALKRTGTKWAYREDCGYHYLWSKEDDGTIHIQKETKPGVATDSADFYIYVG